MSEQDAEGSLYLWDGDSLWCISLVRSLFRLLCMLLTAMSQATG